MKLMFLSTLVVLAFATYLSAIAIGLLIISPSALRERLIEWNRPRAGEWLVGHIDSVRLAVSLMRSVLRVAFIFLVTIEVIGLDGALTVKDLALAGILAVLGLWAFTAVLSSALARYAAVGLVASALPLLRVLHYACFPLTMALGFVDEAVRRLTGANLKTSEAGQSILRSIEDTHREGGLDEEAATLLENVVEFSTTDVGEVMTPRTDIEGIELTDDLALIREIVINSGHSRIPVYEGNLDQIVGVLYVKDLIRYIGTDTGDFRLRPLLRQAMVVPETKPVRDLLADFQSSEVHMAMVIDEYGGTAGLVTIEDVLEEIVGEIHDEHEPDDDEEPTFEAIDESRAEVDGRFHIDDLNEQLGLELPEDEEFDTVAGFVLAHLGHVPAVGETFESHNARFTAIEATSRAVQRIGVELLAPADGNADRRRRSEA